MDLTVPTLFLAISALRAPTAEPSTLRRAASIKTARAIDHFALPISWVALSRQTITDQSRFV